MSGERGFTLIELGLVVAIISIILLVAVADLRKFASRIEMDTTAYRLFGLFSYARTESIIKGSDYRVSFDKGTGEYSVSTLPAREILHGRLPQSLKISEISSKEATFHPDGTSTPFQIEVRDSPGRHIRLKVLPYTGRVILNED